MPAPSSVSLRGRRAPRVDDDEPSGLARAEQVGDERRHRRGDIRTEQQDRARVVEVLDRERQPAVDAERAVSGGCGGRHAEPAVVVDARRAERDPGELAELVGLLVGEPATAEHADRVSTVDVAAGLEAGGDQVEGLTPPDRGERAIHLPLHRFEDAVGRSEQFGRGPALLAEAAAVRRESPARSDVSGTAESAGVARQHHRALQRAVRAM